MRLNPETGFLESPLPTDTTNIRFRPFDSARKLEFLGYIDDAIAENAYPNLTQISKKVGIALRTFEHHVKLDKAFNEAWQERRAQLREIFTVVLSHKAIEKNGTLANLAMVRFFESGTFNPNGQFNAITEQSGIKSVVSQLNDVIDGEIVDETPQLPSQGSAPK